MTEGSKSSEMLNGGQQAPPESRPSSKGKMHSPLPDLGLGLVLIGVCGYVCYHALSMPRQNGWARSAGTVPLALGALLGVMSLVLLLGALRRGAVRALQQRIRAGHLRLNEDDRRALIVFGALLVYFFVLLYFVPFEVATSLFLFVMFCFYWKTSSLIRVVTALLAGAGFYLVFRILLQIGFLPGTLWTF